MVRSCALTLIILTAPWSADGADFRLAFPVDCKLGEDCIIQNYVDLDPSEKWHDFNCGSLTYNGHKGTDIRIRDYQAMQSGVAVLAAADGEVLALRNDMDDRGPGQTYRAYLEKIAGKECGNGVVLGHEGGYQTQYCHLRKSSVAVSKGAKVQAGDVLGYIGMSGKTQFPHLHLSLRRGDEVIGPFTGRCSGSEANLWKEEMGYTPTQLFKYGFADRPQSLQSIEAAEAYRLTPDSKALVFLANVVDIRRGDLQEMKILKPDGSVLVENSQKITASKVNWLGYIGRKRPSGGWTKGTYKALYRLERRRDQIIKAEAALTIE